MEKHLASFLMISVPASWAGSQWSGLRVKEEKA